MMRFDLRASQQLQQTLNTLATRRVGVVLRRATMAAMQQFGRMATSQIPVRTGRLRSAMSTYQMRSKPQRGGARYVWPSRQRLGISRLADYYYPAMLEYGWVTRPGKTSGRRRRIAPKTNIRALLRMNQQMLLQVFEQTAWDAIRRFARADAARASKTK